MTVTKKLIIHKYVDIVYKQTNYSNEKSTMIIRKLQNSGNYMEIIEYIYKLFPFDRVLPLII
jgi:hypothetical protein